MKVGAVTTSSRGLAVLALVSDAHGGFGGISQYNRDVLESISSFDTVATVDVVPRIAAQPLGDLPEKVCYHSSGSSSIASFVKSLIGCVIGLKRADLVYCAHINLLPFAVAASKVLRAPLVLAIYGIDAWQPVKTAPAGKIQSRVSALISISEVTLDRFNRWCPFPAEQTFILPNAIRLEDYGTRGKNLALIKRFGLADRTVLMTFGRMSDKERYKGFDQVIELLPRFMEEIPDVIYLAVGDGSDRQRLEAKVARLNLQDRVVFTGRIDDNIKSDIYGLADVYVMPSTGEGFGFVVLEALASGVPVVASSQDGTCEAVRGGELGIVVDPNDSEALHGAVLEALKIPRGVLDGLSYFAFNNFSVRLRKALSTVCDI